MIKIIRLNIITPAIVIDTNTFNVQYIRNSLNKPGNMTDVFPRLFCMTGKFLGVTDQNELQEVNIYRLFQGISLHQIPFSRTPT